MIISTKFEVDMTSGHPFLG